MEASGTQPRASVGTREQPPAGSTEATKQRRGLPDGAPEGLERMAGDPPESLEADESAAARAAGDQLESGALDFLLGNPEPIEYDVPVKLDTPSGRKSLTFRIRQLDGSRILQLERENRKGTGPFAELDDLRFNAAIVAAATLYIEDEAGVRVEPQSPEFAAQWRDPKLAMEKRFEFQPGILDGITAQIRAVSGYTNDRVEDAERAVVDAAGN